MIIIKEKESINKVWKKALTELYKKGFIPNNNRFVRMESLAIEIEHPILEKKIASFRLVKKI